MTYIVTREDFQADWGTEITSEKLIELGFSGSDIMTFVEFGYLAPKNKTIQSKTETEINNQEKKDK